MIDVSKKIIKTAISVFCVLLLLAGVFGYVVFGVKTRDTDDISYYLSLYEASQSDEIYPKTLYSDSPVVCDFDLPDKAYLDSCLDYRFNFMQKLAFIFMSDSYVLVCEFFEEDYEKEKQILAEKYPSSEKDFRGEDRHVDSKFELDGFSFYAVEGSDVKQMLLVGVSDSTNEIAYIFFYDPDIDYIDNSMSAFIKKETGWKKVV